MSFYKIPISQFKNTQLIYFDINHPDYQFGLKEDPACVFSEIDISRYEEMVDIPKQAIESFQGFKERGFPSAPPFAGIPHVFVKESISIEGLDVIDWT